MSTRAPSGQGRKRSGRTSGEAPEGPAAPEPGLEWAVAGPGPGNAITDVGGVTVGHLTRNDPPYLTGTTVVLVAAGAVGGADVRGGAPATHEIDVLDPRNLVERLHAIVLTGGSAYGLEAATGTMRFLEERAIGLQVGAGAHEVVPCVPAAAIFDLGRGGSFTARPDASFGYEAARSADGGAVAMGNVGAGTGAQAGGLKAGVGTASVEVVNGARVGALVVVNAAGSAVDPRTGALYGSAFGIGDEFVPSPGPATGSTASARGRRGARPAGAPPAPRPPGPRGHTTIGVVATDVALTKAEAQKMAGVAHDGLARAVRPAHTLFDGDTLFAISTGAMEIGEPAGAAFGAGAAQGSRALSLIRLFEHGADCVARAVAHAMLAAEDAGGFPCYRQASASTAGEGRPSTQTRQAEGSGA